MAKIIFKNTESLHPFIQVLNEVDEAVGDPSRTIAQSSIPDVLGAMTGATIGGAGSFLALFYCGSVTGISAAGITSALAFLGRLIGQGMLAGIGILAVAVTLPTVAGYAIFKNIKGKKLKQFKESLYQVALKKLDALIRELDRSLSSSEERVEYLTKLNILLRKGIEDLKSDLT